MKKSMLLIIATIGFAITFNTSCKMSTDQLAKEVEKSMYDTWRKEGLQNNEIIIDELVLSHKSDNEYTGILKTNESGDSFVYSVKVIYDGNNMTWEIVE